MADFIVFILLVWAVAAFHRRMHVIYCKEALELPAFLSSLPETAWENKLRKRDWRIVGYGENRLFLRRAFETTGGMRLARHALPVIFFMIMLIGMENWLLAFVYLIAVQLALFGTKTEIVLTGEDRGYAARFFGLRLFGETVRERQF